MPGRPHERCKVLMARLIDDQIAATVPDKVANAGSTDIITSQGRRQPDASWGPLMRTASMYDPANYKVVMEVAVTETGPQLMDSVSFYIGAGIPYVLTVNISTSHRMVVEVWERGPTKTFEIVLTRNEDGEVTALGDPILIPVATLAGRASRECDGLVCVRYGGQS